ncbi:transcriptional regulator BetI [Cypionkella sp.]|uniref:choline-binding transcriptional repressor BetI n=1 Tax=Cypionkella sp. TaxID=2811411 RepID=UPI00262CD763|nr:transcriptional regulator BetI [Cypionkella sp.]MDB5666089.1 betI [Cypionkella sp.]
MPKLGMEPIRKAALVKATIVEIGLVGSLDVTVSQIAKRAGMSSALAHHYFGSKEEMFLAAMRHILTLYGAEVRGALALADGPESRLRSVLAASFSATNFRREAVGAWLNFWVLAQTAPEARRLLKVYQRRLRSNLLAGLRPLAGDRAEALADGLGALIDGLYLREVLKSGPPDRAAAIATALNYLNSQLEGAAHAGAAEGQSFR